jgi:hypothetical protein
MCWGSLNLGPWEITFRRLSCWMIFRTPVITCPDGLYWKGEWEQSQVRGFLRYSSMLISCNASLYKGGVDPFSPKYRLSSIICDVASFRLFKPVRSEPLHDNNRKLITSDYMSRWVVLKRRVGAVTSQRVLKVLFYVNILQCFFVVENCTANAVSVPIGDNGNKSIFEIWWNFFYEILGILDLTKEV